MPAAPIFLADGHVLRAHDLAALLEFRDADVAADALADVLEPSFRDLGRQERIGDGGARGADDVEHAGPDQRHHVVRAREPSVADHRNAGAEDRLALLDEGRHPAGFAKARNARILAPLGVVADLQCHRIDHALAAEQLQHAHAVLVRLDAFGTVQRVHLEARGDAAPVPQCALERVQQLDEEPRAVREAAAVVIRAPIEARLEKLNGQRVVARGDLEQIEPRLLGALARFDVHVDDGADVELVHFAAVHRTGGEDRRQPLARARPNSRDSSDGRVAAAVPQLNAGETAVAMGHLAHVAQIATSPSSQMRAEV